MGIIIWAAAVGALFGWVASDYSEFGFIAGGLLGAAMGAWLRSAIRAEIQSVVRSALTDAALPAMPTEADRLVDLPEPPHAAESPSPEPEAAANIARASPRPVEAVLHASPMPAEIREPLGPTQLEIVFGKARDWLLGGNTIARAGLAILFVGLVFLARLAANAGLFPIEVRLTAVAAAGVALLAVGLLKRTERPSFALSLQGGGIAVLYLVVFAAAKAYEVMPPLAAFGFMILFAALGCALAVMQNSQSMALASFLGGFAVPVLLGGESETPLGLFAYMTVLNVAILVIAWKKSWRPLNLLGFFATFALASMWGLAAYEEQHYALCQAFLLVSIAIYLATAVLYAHNTPGKLGNYADSTLLFGTALVGFGLQAGLVHDRPFASAFSALGFGAIYLGVTAFTMRKNRPEMRFLNECLLAIGVGFVTLAVPLALDVKWAASTWALEGAGAFWVGARQARWIPRAFGLALQVAASLMVLASLEPNISAVPFANNGVLAPMLIALPVLFTAWLMRHPLDHSGSSFAKIYAPLERGLRHGWFIGGFLFVCIAIVRETTRLVPALTTQDAPQPALPYDLQFHGMMLAILAAMALAQWFGRRKSWAVATWPGRLSLPLVSLCFITAIINARHVLYLPDAVCWAVALGLHAWLLRQQPNDHWTKAMHVGGVLLVTALVADCLSLAIDRGSLWNTSWAGVVFLVSATAMLAVLTRWAGKAAPLADTQGFSWPRDPHAKAYWWYGALALAFLVYLGAMTSTLMAEGVTDPLPYVPILNPVDLSAMLALATLALWRRMVSTAKPSPAGAEMLVGGGGLAAGAILAFAIANTIWLRTAHHFLGLGWDAEELAGSQLVQTGYSILWTLIAMGLMLFARRRAERLPWLAGAVLLAVVVAKLLFVDMSNAESLARIVAFIGVGLLMLLIGYFVPLPPRTETAVEEDS